MLRYIVNRVLISIPTLLAISIIVFGILALAPGDPMGEFALDPSITAEMRAHIRASFGLDEPLHIRYIKWVVAFSQGDMGYSFISHVPVRTLLAQRLSTTLWVVGAGYAVSVLLVLLLGMVVGFRPYSTLDYGVTMLALIGFSVPTFLTGMLCIVLFSVKLRWLPFIYDGTLRVTDWSTLVAQVKQSLMPVLVLALFQTATLLRFVRSAMHEQLHQDYVMAARAKGLRERAIVYRHVLSNALIPVVTLVALGIPTVFTGALVTEQIFRVPGIGSLLVRAIQGNDTPVVMAITFIYAILVVTCNLIADVVYGILDPRIIR